MKRGGFQKTPSIIDEILSEIKPPNESVLELVSEQWPDIVGAPIASHASPSGIEGATLVVRVSNHVWQAELCGGLGKKILEKLQSRVSRNIRRIKWVVGQQ